MQQIELLANSFFCWVLIIHWHALLTQTAKVYIVCRQFNIFSGMSVTV